jgi:hypothetical protein
VKKRAAKVYTITGLVSREIARVLASALHSRGCKTHGHCWHKNPVSDLADGLRHQGCSDGYNLHYSLKRPNGDTVKEFIGGFKAGAFIGEQHQRDRTPKKPKGGMHDGFVDALLIAGYGERKLGRTV